MSDRYTCWICGDSLPIVGDLRIEATHAGIHESYRHLYETIEKHVIEKNYDTWFLEGAEYGIESGDYSQGVIDAYKHCEAMVETKRNSAAMKYRHTIDLDELLSEIDKLWRKHERQRQTD